MHERSACSSSSPAGYFPGVAWQLATPPVEPVPVPEPTPTVVVPQPARGVTVTAIDASRMEALALVRLVVTHPDVWRGFAHDFMGSPEDFVPPWLGQREYLIAKKNKHVAGVFMLTNFQFGLWIAHVAFFPWAKGRDVAYAAKLCARIMLHRSDCWMLIGLTPATNKAALYSSRRMGFKRVGTLPGATRVEGRWTDLVVSQMTMADLRALRA